MTDPLGNRTSVGRTLSAARRRRWALGALVLALVGLNALYAVRARRALASLELQSIEPTIVPAGADATGRVITVGADAVAKRGGRAIVFEVRDGRVTAKPVVLGREQHGRVVIIAGLEGSETLVAQPPEGMQDGDPVRLKK